MGALRYLKRWRFWRRFLTHAFAALGLESAVAGLIDAFNDGALDGWGGLIWAGLLVAVVYGAVVARPRPVVAHFSSPQTTIRVISGDVFEQETHLVVGACDTFDTAMPYIAQNSVQGQFLERVYGGDVTALDRDLEVGLQHALRTGEITKSGKTDKFEIGTVATLRTGKLRYFFLAYTEMDHLNKAHGTADGLWKSLATLWRAVRIESNGAAVSVPVIGGGQSGLSPVLPAEDAIRFIALSFIIASRGKKVCDELRIVALPDQYDRLNHLELQAFLSGLSRS